jgi:hypothetical protein
VFYYELEDRCRLIVEMDSREQKERPKRKKKEKEGDAPLVDGKEQHNLENPEEETDFLKDDEDKDKTSSHRNTSLIQSLPRGKRIKRVTMGQFDFVSPLRARKFLESRDLMYKLQKVVYYLYLRIIV